MTKKEKLSIDIANYIFSEGDHNTREVVKDIMRIIKQFKWWVSGWHEMNEEKRPKPNND